MAWHQPGNKPLSEPMMATSLMHISLTLEFLEKTTDPTGDPSCALLKVLIHLLLTPSQILMVPSSEADTYMWAVAQYFTCGETGKFIRISTMDRKENCKISPEEEEGRALFPATGFSVIKLRWLWDSSPHFYIETVFLGIRWPSYNDRSVFITGILIFASRNIYYIVLHDWYIWI